MLWYIFTPGQCTGRKKKHQDKETDLSATPSEFYPDTQFQEIKTDRPTMGFFLTKKSNFHPSSVCPKGNKGARTRGVVSQETLAGLYLAAVPRNVEADWLVAESSLTQKNHFKSKSVYPKGKKCSRTSTFGYTIWLLLSQPHSSKKVIQTDRRVFLNSEEPFVSPEYVSQGKETCQDMGGVSHPFQLGSA